MSISLLSEAGEKTGGVCECKPDQRVACDGSPSFQTPEGRYYCVVHFPGREKRLAFKNVIKKRFATNELNFQGAWFPDEFAVADFSSGAVVKSDANFKDATFTAVADFSGVQFEADARFIGTTFSGPAIFTETQFQGAIFSRATFNSEVSFEKARFNAVALFPGALLKADASFKGAKFFSGADFTEVAFNANGTFRSAEFIGGADFSEATFAGYADFRHARFDIGNQPASRGIRSLNLRYAKIEKTDHLSFHTLNLHPHWFVDVDARKIDFSYVDWENRGKIREEVRLVEPGQEVSSLLSLIQTTLKERGTLDSGNKPKTLRQLWKTNWSNRQSQKASVKNNEQNRNISLRLLDITCRKLAANAEDNGRYSEASQFRRMALDAERLGKWRGFAIWKLNPWYWASSGYGERPFHAFLVLIGMCLAFALVYTRISARGWEQKPPVAPLAATVGPAPATDLSSFGSAFVYSLNVITLQKPDPRPATTWPQLLVLSETILGPLQAAMLALAIRRRFMR